MSAAQKTIVSEMAKFKPKEPRDEFRVLMVKSLAADLEVIARVRTEVNKIVGDGTSISVTSMLLEEAAELREEQFAKWGGKPDGKEAEAKLIARLAESYKADAEQAAKSKKR